MIIRDKRWNYKCAIEDLKDLSIDKNSLVKPIEGSSTVRWAVLEIKALRSKLNESNCL